MYQSTHPDVDAAIDELVSRLRETLGIRLSGLYLYGSLVVGDFDREISDIDLVAVTPSELTDLEFDALQRMHNAFTDKHTEWDDRVDIIYVSADTLRSTGPHTSRIAVISPGEPFHRASAAREWRMNWYFVREHGQTFLGPPPPTVIRPIVKDEFVQVVRDHARNWAEWVEEGRGRKAQAYAILTICRALYADRHGEQVSKKRAALWAAEELPQWSPLIQSALAWRSPWRDDDVDHDATFPETRRFVRFVIGQIAK